MGNRGFKNTYGEAGATWGHPTMTPTTELNTAPMISMSVNSGSLNFVDATGTITVTSSLSAWNTIPVVGDKVYIVGSTNYDGIFTLTAVTQSTITFTATSAGNESVTSADGVINLIYTPVKNFQDVAFSSGVPNSTEVAFGGVRTLEAKAGVYSYFSASNGTDVTLTFKIAGGELKCPAGSSIGHEIRPFTGNVTCDATAASLGTFIMNIS